MLNPFQYTDNEDISTHWVSDPKISNAILQTTHTTKEEVSKLLDGYIRSYERPDYYRWAIIEKESG